MLPKTTKWSLRRSTGFDPDQHHNQTFTVKEVDLPNGKYIEFKILCETIESDGSRSISGKHSFFYKEEDFKAMFSVFNTILS